MNGAAPLLAVAVLWLSDCDAAPELTMPASSDMAVSEPEMASRAGAEQSAEVEPRIIRSATARIEVSDPGHAVGASREQVARLGGIIAESEINSRSDARSASLLIRVPADSLDELLENLESLGDVHSIAISSTDISREYFDAETRLAVKEETVRRLTDPGCALQF
jgi:hypothetical protein